jgi:V/A-type H+-transporting ATPase subunit D
LAKRILLTRPELKRRRDMLAMFERYLPMLKLKQQQLQVAVRKLSVVREELAAALDQARRTFSPYSSVLGDVAGLDVRGLSTPENVRTSIMNVAGVNVPVFEGADFRAAAYSLFATPVWVDKAIEDLREIGRKEAEAEVLERQHEILDRELTKILQRVNLFEKVKIPECREAIRVIRIKLGDEMTSAVGRAKIAKSKLADSEREIHSKEHAALKPQ